MSDIEETAKIHVPFPIHTDRLILRNVMPGDGAALFEAKAESIKELRHWMPWAKNDDTLEETEKLIAESHEKFLKREDIMILGFNKKAAWFFLQACTA